MKQLLQSTSLILALLVTAGISAQDTRYLDEIFDSNQFIEGETIGFNVDALRSDFGDLAGFGADMVTLNEFIANGETPPLNYFASNSDLPEEQQTVAKLFPIDMDVYLPPAEDTETEASAHYLYPHR